MAGKSGEDLSVWINLCVVDLSVTWLKLLVFQLIVFECVWTSHEYKFRLMWVISNLEVVVSLLSFNLGGDLRWQPCQANVYFGCDLDLIPIPHEQKPIWLATKSDETFVLVFWVKSDTEELH